MTTTITLSCPNCQQQIKAPQEAAGKQVRCKACGEVFTAQAAPGKTKPVAKAAPAKKPGAKAAGKPKKDEVYDEWSDRNPYDVTEQDHVFRCPHCAGEMESEDAVVCLHCGYNTQTRVKGQTLRVIKTTFPEWVAWLGPGILCVLMLVPLGLAHVYLWGARFPTPVKWMPTLEFAPAPETTFSHPEVEGSKEGPLVDGMLWARIWGSVFSAAFMYGCAWFAVRRLVMNPKPPLKVKEK